MGGSSTTIFPEIISMCCLARTVVSNGFLANLLSLCHTALARLSKVHLRLSLPPASAKFNESLVKNAADLIHSLIAGSCSKGGNVKGLMRSIRNAMRDSYIDPVTQGLGREHLIPAAFDRSQIHRCMVRNLPIMQSFRGRKHVGLQL